MILKERQFTGITDSTEQAYEMAHRKLAREAAGDCVVLLKNEQQVLPISKGQKIALYGAGAVKTIKGGTGSGDVNSRRTISIYEGLKAAGYTIATEEWIREYEKIYEEARISWRNEIWKKRAECDPNDGTAMFNVYVSTPFIMPAGGKVTKTDADTAVYVISRIAGEGADCFVKEGQYLLTSEEKKILDDICADYEKVVVVINAGGLMDLSFLEEHTNIMGLIYLSQPGMEAGHVLADVVSGKVVPSAKMTDSWAYKYEDYPNQANYSHNNGNTDQEVYEEGIYVGYRYFDSFQVPVRYGFGYGLSYTQFELKTIGITHYDLGTKDPSIGVKVQVTNTGKVHSGREVVQVYVSCPQEKMTKEYRRLVGFQKTEVLIPGEMQEVEIRVPLYTLASYCEKTPGWVLEKGCYGIFVGNSLGTAECSAALKLTEDFCMVRTEHVCVPQRDIKEFEPSRESIQELRLSWLNKTEELPTIILHEGDIVTETIHYGTAGENIPQEIREFVNTLTEDQLIQLVTGDPGKGQGSMLGSSGISVPGSAAETSRCAVEQNLGSIVLADGPAGLRLNKNYFIHEGSVVQMPFETSIEDGFLCKEPVKRIGEERFQYCTAIPVGTALAQSFDPDLVERVGQMVAEELQMFNVTLWLAPGMNIHRNPLCGRNFEYYSEDPLVAGVMAAAMTKGVQKDSGCGTTIKHFACNNQEDNRMASDSIVSERTLRELYLKGFEIAVKMADPWSIMTSYNLINGIHAANNRDLCTKVAREEWGFKGVIMTDWTTTQVDDKCTASGCMRAGNDLVMPGVPTDHENMRAELKAGTLTVDALRESVAHLVTIVWKSNCYER